MPTEMRAISIIPFILLSFLSLVQACLYTPTQCQCSIESDPGKCMRFQSGSDTSAICLIDDCQAGNYKCDCGGDSLCNISPCDAWIPLSPLTGLEENGDSVGCYLDLAGSATARVCPVYAAPLTSTTPTASPTSTATASASASPSSTSTPSDSASTSPLASASPTSTPSGSPSTTPSPRASSSSTTTPTASPSGSPSPSATSKAISTVSSTPSPGNTFEVRIGPASSGANMFDMPRFTDTADIALFKSAQTPGQNVAWSYPEHLDKHYLNVRLYEDAANSDTIACIIYNRDANVPETAYSMSVNAVLTGLDGQTLTNLMCDDYLVAPSTAECNPTSGNVISYSHSMLFSEANGFCFKNLREGGVRLQFTDMQFFKGVSFQGPDGDFRAYDFASANRPSFMGYSSLDQNGLTIGGNFELYVDVTNKLVQVGPPNSPTPSPSTSSTPSASVSPSASATPLPSYEVRVGPAAPDAELFNMPRFYDAADIALFNTPQVLGNQIVWSYPQLLRKHWIQFRFYEDDARGETIGCLLYNKLLTPVEDNLFMSVDAILTGLNGQTLTTKICDEYLVSPELPECFPVSHTGNVHNYNHRTTFSSPDGVCFSNLRDGPVSLQFYNVELFAGFTFQGPTGQVREYEFASDTLAPYIYYDALDQNNLSVGGSFQVYIDIVNKLQQVRS